MRSRISIERSTETVDASGSVVQSWQLIANRRADIRPIRGREYLAAGQTVGEVTHTIRLRYEDLLADLSPKDQITKGNRKFDIVSVQNLMERSREFELMCREVV